MINNSPEIQWDKIAENYSLKKDKSIFPFNVLQRFSGIYFLEAGSGDGEVAFFMAGNKNKVIGLEISDRFLEISNKSLENSGLDNLTFVKGDVRKMPFEDSKFDLIFSGGVVEHFDETFEAVSEHIRVLKENGHLLIGVPCKQGLHYPLKKIMQFLGIWKIGFEKSYTKRYFKKHLVDLGLKIEEEFYIPLEATKNQSRIRYIITYTLAYFDKILSGTHMMYFLCKKK